MTTEEGFKRLEREVRWTRVGGAALLLLGLCVPAAGASAWPASPMPLRYLWAGADLVCVAKVGTEEPVSTKECHTEFGLRVNQVLKGAPEVGRVVVRVNHGILCPWPARFVKGATVLAFLAREPDGAFRTVGRSYGAIHLNAKARKKYVNALLDLKSIESMRDRAAQKARMVEWIVRLLEDETMRPTILLEIGRAEIRSGRLTGDWREPVTDWRKELTPAQQRRVAKVLLTARGSLWQILSLAQAVPAVKHPRIDRVVLGEMARANREGLLLPAVFLDTLVARTDDAEVKRIVRRARRINRSNQGAWSTVIEDLRRCFPDPVDASKKGR